MDRRNKNEANFKGYAKICRYHFRESDFTINHRGQRGLRPKAVPSLNLPGTFNVTQEHSYSSVYFENISIDEFFY